MKLTGRLLMEKLRAQLSVLDDYRWDADLSVGRPQFYDAAKAVVAGRLYITDAPNEVLCKKGVLCIYTNGTVPSRPIASSITVHEGLLQTFNAVQQIFDILEQWQSGMEQLVLEKGSLQQLLQLSHPITGNPMMVVDEDFALTAQVGQELIPESVRLFDGNFDSIEVINALKQDELYNQMRGASTPYLFPAHIIGWRSWNVNLYRQREAAGRLILIEQQRSLTEGDVDILQMMAPYVTFLLEQEWSAHRPVSTLSAIFHRILSDRMADYVEMSLQLSALEWGSDDSYFCVVLKSAYQDQGGLAVTPICDSLERKYCCCCFLYQEEIVVFFNLSKEERSFDLITNEMKYFIREGLLRAGYSRVGTGHNNLRRRYVQACAAMNFGNRLRPHLWIHNFDSVALPYLLEQATRHLPADMVSHQKLLLLRQHDEQQHTQYMQTLRIYLDTNLNAVQTAKRLFIHRSTFLYRLDRIREILDSKLEDPDELLYLSLSFRLLERDQ